MNAAENQLTAAKHERAYIWSGRLKTMRIVIHTELANDLELVARNYLI